MRENNKGERGPCECGLREIDVHKTRLIVNKSL